MNPFTSSGLFGTLFSDNAINAEFSAQSFLARILAFETAWTQALCQSGLVPEADANTAIMAIESFNTSDIAVLGAGTDKDGLPVPALVKALRAGLNEGPARAIHSGATSQDAIDSAMALTFLAVLDKLSAELARSVRKLEELDLQFGNAPLMARTRMQAAMPTTVSHRLSAWKRALADRRARVDEVRAEIGRIQAGGAIGRRDLPQDQGDAVAADVAKRLGLSPSPVWHTDRSGPVALGHWLVLVSGTVGKIGQDMALMAQQGVDELRLADAGTSSAMPHKQNPETIVALARYVASLQGGLAHAMIHEQERSGAAWALEWLTLPTMAEATGTALSHLNTLLSVVERIGGVPTDD